MATAVRADKLEYRTGIPEHADISTAEAALRAKLSRKRTKTGCLTCRKRRIKCDEERPVCKNCTKSKRQCEGYNQRVVFRQPSFDHTHAPNRGPLVTFHAAPQPGPPVHVSFDHAYAHVPPGPAYHHQPAHPASAALYAPPAPHYGPGFPAVSHEWPTHAQYPYPVPIGVPQPPPGAVNANVINAQVVIGGSTGPHYPDEHRLSNGVPPAHIHPSDPSVSLAPYPSGPYAATDDPIQLPADPFAPSLFPNGPTPNRSPPRHSAADYVSPTSTLSSRTLRWSQGSVPEARSHDWTSPQYIPRPELSQPFDSNPLAVSTSYAATSAPAPLAPLEQARILSATPDLFDYLPPVPTSDATENLLRHAAVEMLDDDYYDVSPDEEMDVDTLALTTLAHERSQNLHRILRLNNIDVRDLQTRRYDTFLYEGILDHYRVEDAANPLRNPATARVFAHFIAVTGPSLSAFERHPRNTSVLFNDGQVPLSQRGLWTYTMPVAALNHQGLLHSMLALASLHIARLQNASDTPSRQHYAWACKRINHLLGPNSKKRHKTTTIAASMLLGFYEIFTADHRAWNLHLTGSKQLFSETDFVALARKFRRAKRDRATRPPINGYCQFSPTYLQSTDEKLDEMHDVDDAMVSRLFGAHVSYDDPDQLPRPYSGVPRELDLSNFEILKDLYWWYLKQDAYQSIISGNPLLLDYDLWANCPPRAPIGRLDAVYGSFDHLILLLGRIANFSCRDRKRKLRQMEANGGAWRPAPGMKMPGTPAASQRGSQQPTPMTTPNGQSALSSYFSGTSPTIVTPAPPPPPQQQQPLFFGMAPAPRQNVQMPAAYMPAGYTHTPAPEPSTEELDLHAATQAALEEYGRIRAALREFSESLGEAFQALDAEFQPPMDTPFGTALFYRSYDIGCLWAIYYMAIIIAIRSHPHAHPASHAAAAIMAQETVFQANEIGRINAGIVPGPANQDLNPTLGAALCESCVPSFFAAVQYKTLPQRHATVMRIFDIALRTGWGTAELIANGCETAWVKAAAAGRGPPYSRIVRKAFGDDPRLTGKWEFDDPAAKPEDGDRTDRRLVRTKPEARLTWAIGVMGTEADEEGKAKG